MAKGNGKILQYCRVAVAVFFLLIAAGVTRLEAQDMSPAEGKIIREIVVEIKPSSSTPKGFEVTEKMRQNVCEALRARMRTRVGQPYNARTMDSDIKRLIARGRFWLGIDVTLVPDGIKLILHVTLRPVVKKVVFRGKGGDTMGIPEDLSLEMLTEKGKHFGRYFLLHDREAIQRYYRKNGYPFASVRSEVKYSEDGVKVMFVVDKGAFAVIRTIIFEGNEFFTDAQLYSFFKQHASVQTLWRELPFFDWLIIDARFDADKVKDGVKEILNAYRGKGFLDAGVTLEHVKFNKEKTDAEVAISVEEGTRYRIRNVAIKGNHVFPNDKLAKKLTLKPGLPYEKEALEKDIDAIAEVYERGAYIYSRVVPDITYDLEGDQVDLTFNIYEGPQIHLDKIRIEGNNRTRDRVIRRQLTVYPGEKFDTRELRESFQRLLNLRYFQALEPLVEDTEDPNRKILLLKVAERKTGQMRFGFSYSTALGLQGVFSVVQPNFDYADLPKSLNDFFSGNAFAGDGTSLSITMQPGKQHSQYGVVYKNPYFMDSNTRFSIGFEYSDSKYTRWDQRKEGFHIGLGRNITRSLSVDLLYRLDINTLTNISPSSPIDVFLSEGTKNLSALKPVITYNKSRLDIHATRYKGYSVQASYEYGGGFMGGEVDFSAASLSLAGYQKIFEDSEGFKHVLSLELSGNWKEPHHNTDIIPWYERFFLGGPGTLRGFEWWGAGPKEGRDFIGGTVRAVASIEYSIPLPIGKEYFRGVLFCDAGNLTGSVDEFLLKEFRTAVGFGLRLRVGNSFVFVMDFGYPVKRFKGDERRTFHFSFGTEF